MGLLFVLSHITKNLLALKPAPSKGIDPSRQNWERALALWEWVLRGQQSPLCEEPEGKEEFRGGRLGCPWCLSVTTAVEAQGHTVALQLYFSSTDL